MRVAFAMESLRFSGGHQVVAEHARNLSEHHGFEVSLVDCFDKGGADWDFGLPEPVEVLSLSDVADRSFDIAVATWWTTAAAMGRISAGRHAHFVQSLEDRWYTDDQPESSLARLTLELGMPVLTEATWIAELLDHHGGGMDCHLVRNGVDKEVFPVGTDRPLRGDGPLKVLVEAGTGHSPNKGVAEAMEALARTTEPVFTTIVGDASGLAAPPGSAILPVLPQQELSALYASHDVLLKCSRVEGMYGPPLEAFHRGATVVTTPVTGHDEFVLHGHNALVTDWDDHVGTARALDVLARDRDLLEMLRSAALETARDWPSWRESSATMAGALVAVAAGDADYLDVTRPIYLGADRFASESAGRSHESKVELEAALSHIEKLQYEWHVSEQARQQLQEERAEARSALESLNAIEEDAKLLRSLLETTTRENDMLRSKLDARIEARLAQVLRRAREFMQRH